MIKLQNVQKSYKLDEDIVFTALKDISLQIKKGEFTSIVGRPAQVNQPSCIS